jgi:hypothetical protein
MTSGLMNWAYHALAKWQPFWGASVVPPRGSLRGAGRMDFAARTGRGR